MRKFVSTALAGLALAGSAIGVAAPAEAQHFHGGGGGFHGGGGYHGGGGWHGGGGYRGGGWRGGYRGGWHGGYGGGAFAAGILGLGVGAALASHPYGYYGYGGGYYDAPYGYAAYDECRTDWRWDGWRGRYVPVRYCD